MRTSVSVARCTRRGEHKSRCQTRVCRQVAWSQATTCPHPCSTGQLERAGVHCFRRAGQCRGTRRGCKRETLHQATSVESPPRPPLSHDHSLDQRCGSASLSPTARSHARTRALRPRRVRHSRMPKYSPVRQLVRARNWPSECSGVVALGVPIPHRCNLSIP
jgi:hypothetical protein